MALMNVYDKLVMGPDAGNLEGAIEKKWFKSGVYNIEQLNPTPFMNELNNNGLSWKVHELN